MPFGLADSSNCGRVVGYWFPLPLGLFQLLICYLVCVPAAGGLARGARRCKMSRTGWIWMIGIKHWHFSCPCLLCRCLSCLACLLLRYCSSALHHFHCHTALHLSLCIASVTLRAGIGGVRVGRVLVGALDADGGAVPARLPVLPLFEGVANALVLLLAHALCT